jgi:tetratricopeptide (TPR) repeat protein
MPIFPLLALVAVFVLVMLWLLVGPAPRRRRTLGRAQRLVEQGKWHDALQLLGTLPAEGLSAAWRSRLNAVAGEAHQLAADEALKQKRFEDALEHTARAARLLEGDEVEQRCGVIDAMLADARRLFAAGTGAAETQATLDMLARVLLLQNPCPEASFWQALCLIRQGNTEPALDALAVAHEQGGKQFIDPPLYQGMLLHRQGRHTDALRQLSEANRIDPGCPFVTLQMGLSLVEGGGDSLVALRALQRALGPRGLPQWSAAPDRAWVEAMPEGKSYVRRLAGRHPYVCPILGSGVSQALRLGQQALGAAHYRQGNFEEAADVYTKLLQDSPPTAPLLRGLGLALARLERYDQAYKHLRTALEEEQPKDPITAAYLALCGALGRPLQPEDKPRNVIWAIRLLSRHPLSGNAEWAGLASAVFAEARSANLELSRDDQLLLCDTLAAVHAADDRAAAGYAHLARTFPDALRPAHAWLYVRAASTTGFSAEGDLELFARTFADSAAARAYFTQQGWDFEEVEYAYLRRAAALAPGSFPPALGADYPSRGEAFLLERSRREEQAGRAGAARASMEVLLRLAPANVPGHDRLACLHYRGGDRERAVELLTLWQRLAPKDHWPLVREAIIEQERGNDQRRAEAIDRALGLTRGPLRAAVAFLGARLALRAAVRGWLPQGLRDSQALLQTCLQETPDHVDALWCLAAVRSVLDDRAGLAAQAPAMDRPAVADPRFHYMGAVCHLAAGDYLRVIELAGRSARDDSLAAESRFVMAWAHLHRGDEDAARRALESVASAPQSPSAPCARAILGRLHLQAGGYDEAARWWQAVEPARRSAWGLDEPLRQTVLLSGLTDLRDGRFEQAAERFREAGRLGLRDPRLGPLLTLALVQAGQRLLYDHAAGPEG